MTVQQSKRGGPSAEVTVLITIMVTFALVTFWIVGNIQSDYDTYPSYSTFSTHPDGARGLLLLCQELGLDVDQFYETEYDYPKQSAMVVLNEEGMDTGSVLFDIYDFSAVLDWVDQGNCLIIATPPQSILAYGLTEELGTEDYATYSAEPHVTCTFTQGGETGKTTALQRIYQPGQQYALPVDSAPMWQGLQIFETAGALGAPYFTDAGVLLATSNPPEPVVLHFTRGNGELLWLLRPEIASNKWLGRVDNAQLMWLLMSYAAQYGTIYFDEGVHGYQHQHKNTIQLVFTTPGGWLLLTGLVCVLMLLLGMAIPPARFVVRPVVPRRDSTEMVLAQADLFRRARVTQLVGKGIVDSYRRAMQKVMHEGYAMDERSFREVVGRLIAQSGGGRSLATKYAVEGSVPFKLNELVQFAQELGSLVEHAKRHSGWTQ